MSEKPPRQKDEKPDLLEQMIRNGPPPTLDAIAEHVADYMVALEAIKEECADDPLLAAKRTIRANMCLVAGLSPPGSSGPADLFAPFMEIILTLKTGASPSKTTLFNAAHHSGGGRPPDPPQLLIGQARAAAVMTMLMKSGMKENDAARLVANKLKRAGVKFDRSNANPINNVKEWRSKAEGHGHKPINLAYRDARCRRGSGWNLGVA